MSADSVDDCPVCGEVHFAAYHEFYIRDGELHADYGAECREYWGGCGFQVSHKFDPYIIPNMPKPPPNTGFTGLI